MISDFSLKGKSHFFCVFKKEERLISVGFSYNYYKEIWFIFVLKYMQSVAHEHRKINKAPFMVRF